MTVVSPIKVELPTVRALAVLKQGLVRRPAVVDRSAVLEMIRQIGLLQLDTINVVARSHYLVILGRMGLYDRAWLDALLYPDRQLFEQWAHAACLIPVEDYPFLAPVIWARREAPLSEWRRQQLGENPAGVLDEVLAAVRQRGPLASRDFVDERQEKGSWWNRKPAKQALDLLYMRGHLMVDRRENFQIYYDLAERVMPDGHGVQSKTTADYERWAVRRGLACLGVATASHVSDYYRLQKRVARSWLNQLVAEGEVRPVSVPGWKEIAYLLPQDLALIEPIAAGLHQSEVTAFLSPFDNLAWHRERLLELFGFDYKLEVYVPQAKRKYGYYVLPIFHRGRFVGRLDPKADRQTKRMIIRHLYLEPGVPLKDALIRDLGKALREFMAFHKSQRLVIEASEPASLRQALLNEVEGESR